MKQHPVLFPGSLLPLLMGGLLACLLAHPALGQDEAPPRIEEVLYDGPGGDSDDVFTEIAALPGTALDGWQLVGINGDDGTTYRTVDLSGAVVPASGILVIAHEAAAGQVLAQRDFSAQVDWQNGPDAIQLHDPQGQIVDALQYGDAGPFNAGEGQAAPLVQAGWSLSRGNDTDDNLTDFAPRENPVPGDEDNASTGLVASLPDTVGRYGSRLDLPLRLDGLAGQSLVALEAHLAYDRALLGIDPQGTVPAASTAGWALEANITVGSAAFDTLKIALATSTPTSFSDGPLLYLPLVLANRRQPTSAPLHLVHILLDDGSAVATPIDGRIQWTGSSGLLQLAPEPLLPGADLVLTVTDADLDRNPDQPDTLALGLSNDDEAETVLLVETGSSTGQFHGSVATLAAAPAAANGLVEVELGGWLRACYTDSLDDLGGAAERCSQIAVHGGTDGSLAASTVAQPGDTVRVLLTDADLNLDPLGRESVGLTAFNLASGDSLSVLLTEASPDDSLFAGVLRLDPLGGTGLAAAKGAVIQVRYLDAHTVAGSPIQRRADTAVVGLFGDADGNGQVQAFDAAQVLTHALDPFLTGLDSLSANVDSRAFDPVVGGISPLDAALILQNRVSLIDRFPVQEPGADNHPAGPTAAKAVRHPRLALRSGAGYLAVWADERGAIISGRLFLQGVQGHVEIAPDLVGFQLAYRNRDQGTHIVFAGARPRPGAGELVRLYTRTPAQAVLAEVQLNGEPVPPDWIDRTTAIAGHPGQPNQLRLAPVYPNPFNARTVIPFQLAVAGMVRLSIYNSTGQLVKIVAQGQRPAGSYRAVWDGTDQRGRALGSGRYQVRLSTPQGERNRGIVLLK
ncbi:MAG: T9SS type A sorting domain-containing protein [Candidatus Latescibacteria bacterium]|nr:T9SS type A sorting domain-containing protein [Candidatus Latescibacterota bacterium]